VLPWVHNAGSELFSRRDGHRAVCLTLSCLLSYLPTVLAVCDIFANFFCGCFDLCQRLGEDGESCTGLWGFGDRYEVLWKRVVGWFADVR
jgi:hypothetical protein